MEILAFLILYGIGLILAFLSVKSKSYPIGMFGGLMMFLAAISILSGGIQMPIVEVTINETGSLITDTVKAEVIPLDAIVDRAAFGLPLMLFGLFILINALLEWKGNRD